MSDIELGGDSAEVRDDAPEAEVTPTSLEVVSEEIAPEADAAPAEEIADLQSSLAAVVAGLDDGMPVAEIVEQAEAADAGAGDVAVASSADTEIAAQPSEEIVVEEPIAAEETAPRRVILPYAVYAAAWVVHAVASFVALRGSRDPLSVAAYPTLVFAGLALVVAAPAVVLWAWLTARARTTQRSGLLTTTLLLVSGLAALGVVGWWTVLLAVDAARGAL